MPYTISVVGYASFESLEEKEAKAIQVLARQLGEILVDNGYIIASGGLGGVMEAVSLGARSSRHYTQGCIIGLIPNYDKSAANEYIDIALPLGFDVARNVSVASICDCMVVIGGGSGTLSEMALAWQLNKPIIALGDYGYGGEFKNRALDLRRKDKVLFAKSAQDLLILLRERLSYPRKVFCGITKQMTQQEAKNIIFQHCQTPCESLEFLGKGSEGFVFTDKRKVYKLFHTSAYLSRLYFQLQPIAQRIGGNGFLPPFEIFYKNNTLIVIYDYFEARDFKSVSYENYIELLCNFYYAGVVHCDIQPKNLMINHDNKLFVCDIGWDLSAYSEELFESMCRRTFAIYKLQGVLNSIENIKTFLSPLNNEEDFSAIEAFLGCTGLCDEYRRFFYKIGAFALHKSLIVDFYHANPHLESVFDYGAGSGAIAYAINKLGRKVVGYEIKQGLIKEQYTKSFENVVIGRDRLMEFLKSGRQFHSVLCSLVLCHSLAESKEEALEIVDEIMSDLVNLSKGHILIVICNPLFLHASSRIQTRNSRHTYLQSHSIEKTMCATQRDRLDYHRPLGFYESLFARHGLIVQDIFQSGDFGANYYKISNSDFMFFSLVKE